MIGDIRYQMPAMVQWLYRGVTWRGDKTRKVAYLTFDDGPLPMVTPRVLEILKHYQVPATFFMVGENAERYPELVQMVIEEGHKIGNHTFNHLKGIRVTTKDYMNNVAKADGVLQGTRLFRPPYGKMSGAQKKALNERGYRICLWDVLTHDYDAAYSSEQMVAIVKRYTRHGSIINFHDSVKSNERMLAALPQVIEYLQDEGYVLETL